MDTALGQTTQPVNVSNTGGIPTTIAPPTGTIKNSSPPPINKTRKAPIHEPCQRFITVSLTQQDDLHPTDIDDHQYSKSNSRKRKKKKKKKKKRMLRFLI
jgi:hypothetical protein